MLPIVLRRVHLSLTNWRLYRQCRKNCSVGYIPTLHLPNWLILSWNYARIYFLWNGLRIFFWCQTVMFEIFNLTLSSYLLKTNLKIGEKFDAKGVQNNSIWNHTAIEYWENKPFFKLLYFTFRLPFTKQKYICKNCLLC